jgi:PAS domain S-box-containing protein
LKRLVPRLIVLISVALLPVLGFESYTEYDARQVRQQLVEAEALRLLRVVSFEQQRVVDGAAQVLNAIASTPAVQDDRRPQCHRILANLLAQSPRYVGIGVIGLDGELRCAARPFTAPINLADRFYFQETLRTGGFVAGKYTVDRISGERTVQLARPFSNAAGAIEGVVVVSVNLEWLGAQLGQLDLPRSAITVVTDRDGTILARYPAEPGRIGAPSRGATPLALAAGKAGVVETANRDGKTRLAAYSPPAAEPKGLGIVVGLDRDASFAAATQANQTGLLLIVAGASLAVLITTLLGTQLIRRPFHRLLAAAEQWRGGDLSARSGVAADGSEFGRLGAAFDAMAAALAEREQALSRALESTTDNVVVLDRAWRITYLNGHAKSFLPGDDGLLGRSLWEACPELPESRFGEACRRAVEQGTPTHVIAYMPAVRREVEAHAYPTAEGLTVFFRDAGQERRMAAALVESERIFRATFEQAAVGMAQFGLDAGCLSVNDTLCSILGRPREALIGRPFREVTHPDDREGDRERRRALLAGEVSSISTEKRYLHKDGSAVWANVTVSLLRDAEGRPDRYITVIEDISARKHIETALRESESLLRAVVEQVPAAIVIVQAADGAVALRSRYCEVLRGQSIGSSGPGDVTWLDGAREHPDGRPYAPDEYPIRRALRHGETIIAEPALYRRPNGEPIEFDVYAAPVRDAAGSIIAAVAAAFDTTERNQARRLLAQSNADLEARVREAVAARQAVQVQAAHAESLQALGQLAGGIAHDFNNILQAVEGAVALIERRPTDALGVGRMVRLAREAVGRGASITRRLLAFGRRDTLRAEPMEVAGTLAGIQEILTHTLGAAIAVEVRVADDVGRMLADKGQLETALVNLATNARDAMPNGGRLTLAATGESVAEGAPHPAGLAAGRYVRLTISDDGAGMDAETLRRATEPFFTTKPSGAGTGLGLPMVGGFAERSDGALALASEPGEGTTVTLWLPAAEPGSLAEAAAVAPPDASAPPTAASVLLVDDESLLREVLAEQLADAGYGVAVAAAGAEALGMLKGGAAIDVLVTDLSMPGMDGIALIREARQSRPDLPALLLTGYAGDAVSGDGEIAAPFSLMQKPVRLDALTSRLQSLLAEGRGQLDRAAE